MRSNPGPLPELKWIDKKSFVVDHHYQRHTNSRRSLRVIENIRENFQWARFSPPVVTFGPKDKFLIIDGQHRIEGVQEREDITLIPCYIVPEISMEEQARNFVAINRDRVTLHPLALHRALLATNDPTALKIEEVCEEADVSLVKQPAAFGQTLPRTTAAVGTIKSGINQYGEDCVIAALMVLADAFKVAKGMMRSKTLDALMRFYKDTGIRNVDRDVLIFVLKEKDPITLEQDAMSRSRQEGGSAAAHIVEDIKERYDFRLAELQDEKQ